MSEPGPARHVRVVPGAEGQVSVPADVAAFLGQDALLEVGPGQVVTLRPAKLSSTALAAGVEPLKDASALRHARTPLTAGERAALSEFPGQ